MAEDNSDQNIAQPQDGTQQTAPQTPSENVADEAQTSVTEPIAVPNAGEQPTTALPTVDAADGTAGNTADDTPDYASAAGERTVINNATQDAPTEQYRPAPEYGAYGPVPTPPAGDASGQTVQQPQYGAQQQGQPQDNRPSFFGAFGNPYTTGNQRNNGNPFGNPFGGSSAQNGAQQNNQQQPQYGANMPPAGPGNRNPFGAPGQGFPNQPNQTPVVTKQKSGMTSHVVTAVVAALVSGALCLGVGFTAITNGWVHVPTSSSLSDVKSNTSGSGSAKAKSGTAVDWTAVAKEVSDSVVAIDVATSDGEAKGSGVVISDKGYIATNNHVISGAQQIQVTLASGAVYSAKVVGTDTTTDLAVIKLDNPPSDLKVAEFADSDNLAVGEAVMAIGNPLGYDDTVTTGIVSALNRPVTVTDDDNNAIVTNAVQIDAAINPGQLRWSDFQCGWSGDRHQFVHRLHCELVRYCRFDWHWLRHPVEPCQARGQRNHRQWFREACGARYHHQKRYGRSRRCDPWLRPGAGRDRRWPGVQGRREGRRLHRGVQRKGSEQQLLAARLRARLRHGRQGEADRCARRQHHGSRSDARPGRDQDELLQQAGTASAEQRQRR